MKRPKEDGAEIPALERLVGKVAYRGRPSYIDRKQGIGARPTGLVPSRSRPVHTLDLEKRGIPTNTRVSERNSSKPKFEPKSQIRDSKRRKLGRRK